MAIISHDLDCDIGMTFKMRIHFPVNHYCNDWFKWAMIWLDHRAKDHENHTNTSKSRVGTSHTWACKRFTSHFEALGWPMYTLV